ncbi:MAG: rRNA maturation RNase YbeY [Pseudomonadota bacterium]
MSVDVILEDERWAELHLSDLATRAVAEVLTHFDMAQPDFEVTVLGCDDARISALNASFRETARATNVLSWPSAERGAAIAGETPEIPREPGELGDIAMAYETCQREAADQGKPIEQHILHLIVHGVLHLLGYDHVRSEDGDLMESHEIAILAQLGVPDPYL